ncbi:MAG: CoA transferase [Alphaproteobacteria bacterium TMED87]|nr:CoA transferase [Rhodospirillaceae bacterium]OUV11932.1 MAG: CoA transferase [Alphaproteobacteria bacterium TMED87]
MKLDGIKVVDLSMYLPGPHLTLMMADHGAEVIRVEPPGGEPSRNYGPFQGGHSVWFRNTHRGKKSICLNLKDKREREILFEICKTADIFVEAFRPGVVKRLGVDYEAISKINSKIIYCSVSAFGQSGPLSKKATHDMGAQALTGFLAINDNGNGHPVVPGLPGADLGSSMTALAGILMALYRRTITKRGDYLDATMYDTLLSWTAHLSGPVFAENKPPKTAEGRSIGGAAFYNIYKTKDDRFIALTGREIKFANSLLSALDRPDLVELCKIDDCLAQKPVREYLDITFATKTQKEWEEFLEPLELGWAPVLNMDEAFKKDHAIERNMIIEEDNGIKHVGNPIVFSEEKAKISFDVPDLNEHYDEILKK